MSSDQAKTVFRNVAAVRQQIEDACHAHGRDAHDVRLVAVTKYVDAETAGLLVEAGCCDLGESRPQMLWDKAAALARDLPGQEIRWHQIGSLQRNKVARTLPVASLIHSVDSIRLASTISRLASESGLVQDVLLEINISGESVKHGFSAESLPSEIESLLELPAIRICGLMGMAALGADELQTRQQFALLRKIRDSLAPLASPQHPLRDLSMGMSGDFPWAIAEGATVVRIGSVLFEGLS